MTDHSATKEAALTGFALSPVRDKMRFAVERTPGRSHFAVVGTDWHEVVPDYVGEPLDREMVIWAVDHGLAAPAVAHRHEQGVARRFQELFERWEARTLFSSALDDLIYDLDFQRLVALGPAAIPHILAALHIHPIPFFYALNLMVDDPPVGHEATTDEAVAAWRAWGRARGLAA